MFQLRLSLADAHAQPKLIIKNGVGKEKFTTLVDVVHQLFVEVVACIMAKTHQVKRRFVQ